MVGRRLFVIDFLERRGWRVYNDQAQARIFAEAKFTTPEACILLEIFFRHRKPDDHQTEQYVLHLAHGIMTVEGS